MKGFISNIQRYSLKDGMGIRTVVFFKGCTLKCPWCSNPESINKTKEIFINKNLCVHCNPCFENENLCPTGAYKIIGKYYSIDEVVKEIKKDYIFFKNSNGGVTLSGGEALLQIDFVIELLKKLKAIGIHTAIETCGMLPKNVSINKIKILANLCNEIYFDLKILDDSTCKNVLNGNSKVILETLKELKENNTNIIIRYPLIPNYTDSYENRNLIIRTMKNLNLKKIEILPFHQYGKGKYSFLNKNYLLKNMKYNSKEKIEKIKNYFQENDFCVDIND